MSFSARVFPGISRLMLAMALSLPLVTMTGCGGGGSSVSSRVKQLAGKVYAKLIGDKIGEIKANVKEITDSLGEIEGSLEIDGESFNFKTTVNENGDFVTGFTRTLPGSNIIDGRGEIKGKLVSNPPGSPEPTSAEGEWWAYLPKGPGESASSTLTKGTFVQSNSSQSSSSGTTGGTTTGNLPVASGCEWSPTAFYNPQQTVTYQGSGYTAKSAVVPFGSAGAILFNPASNTSSWTAGGSCGPEPFITVKTAVCTKGSTADTIQMTGEAYGGGIGDAIAAYTNVTDHAGSNENNFGLQGTQYQMTCTGGGFTGTFTSNTSPTYSVCVKTQASNDRVQWSSTQVVPHSTTMVKFTTAYASKGNPLRATVFNVGSIVMGFDQVRSAGVAITGNCD